MAVLNQNQNQNQNQSVAGAAERRFRTRYNSDVASRLANVALPLVPPPPYPRFHPYWDADLQACTHLDHFLAKLTAAAAARTADLALGDALAVKTAVLNAANSANASALSWYVGYGDVAQQGGLVGYKPPHQMSRAELNAEVLRILELGLERDARFSEIIDQDDGPGSINYWLGMLKIDPARHPATYLMVHVGRRIGEHVVMYLKGSFRSPRPSQLSPMITPMIDPPVTPSYPAGHAVQAYLISYLLAYCFRDDGTGATKLPQHTLPAIPALPALPALEPAVIAPALLNFDNPTAVGGPRGPLFDLARRVAENRIVAGIHYPTDIRAGQAVATRIFQHIRNVDSIWVNLRAQVQGDFPQYAP